MAHSDPQTTIPRPPAAPALCWFAQLASGGLLGSGVLFCLLELDTARLYYGALGLGELGWLAVAASQAACLLGLAHPRQAVAAACLSLIPATAQFWLARSHPEVTAGHHGHLPQWIAAGTLLGASGVVLLRGVLPWIRVQAERAAVPPKRRPEPVRAQGPRSPGPATLPDPQGAVPSPSRHGGSTVELAAGPGPTEAA